MVFDIVYFILRINWCDKYNYYVVIVMLFGILYNGMIQLIMFVVQLYS